MGIDTNRPPYTNASPRGSLWRKIAGWALILAGLTGLILPIIPGIPLLIGGLVMLSTEHRWARAMLVWAKRRYQRYRARRAAAKSPTA